ncbi:MAG: hypothetical protein E7614_05720 [Ruminococcaceae bacterium]|nr:hypothetical protein [Oscillospiraceae bacterium]
MKKTIIIHEALRKVNGVFFSFLLAFIFILSSVNFTVVSAELSDSYDLRDFGYVTSVKNQGSANTCWVFSAIGAIESSLIVGGYADSTIDLSEAHLGWFSINTAIDDENDLTYGDGYSTSNPFQYGGNDLYVIWALSRGFGLELEEFAEYDVNNINSTFVRENERYVSEYTVTEVNIFEKTEITSIKKAIVKNGALMASYRDTPTFYSDSENGYCFFENLYTTSNHAALIVGWDDNFSKDNFGTIKPTTDGAWLCRNTRGESWGDDGYFWISYETSSLKRIVSFTAKPSENDIHQIYQYDGYGFSKSLVLDKSGTVYNANIFDATENGLLKKIAFYAADPELEHEISVYALNEGYTSPTDGELLCRFNRFAPAVGYYLCDLPSPVPVIEGKAFSIVLKISGDTEVHFYTEGTDNRTSSIGKSFASADCINWIDIADNNYGNLCIKAHVEPEIYEAPDIQKLYDFMLPMGNEYYEDRKLSSLLEDAKEIISNGGSEREVLNNYLRLFCLYEKYYGHVTIENEEQFFVFADLVNNGNKFLDTVFVLTNDLDFSGLEFSFPSTFGGIFNGKNHSIKGINHQDDIDLGLFGHIQNKGIIKNIIVKDCTLSSTTYAGGIAARNSGLIINCAVYADLHSEYMNSGGIAGYNDGTIINCAVKSDTSQSNFGGIAGTNYYGTIKDCVAECNSFAITGNDALNTYKVHSSDDCIFIQGIKVPNSLLSSFVKLLKDIEPITEGYAHTDMIIGDYVIVLSGDVDGNGMLSATDYLRIKQYFLGTLPLTNSQIKAADIDSNGRIESTDYLSIKLHFLKLTDIYGG